MREPDATLHVAQNNKRRGSAIDGRTTRHAVYQVSQRIRKRIEDVFGWMKTVGGQRKTRYRGTPRVNWMFTLSAAAYNLTRMPKLLGAAAQRHPESVRNPPGATNSAAQDSENPKSASSKPIPAAKAQKWPGNSAVLPQPVKAWQPNRKKRIRLAARTQLTN
jgi:hypothetical protein